MPWIREESGPLSALQGQRRLCDTGRLPVMCVNLVLARSLRPVAMGRLRQGSAVHGRTPLTRLCDPRGGDDASRASRVSVVGFVVLLWGEVFDAFASLLPKERMGGGVASYPRRGPLRPRKAF